jgi:hypothetical protein
MEIRSYQYTALDYCDMFNRKEVRVNREYQRSDQVWPREAQSFLIETILLNFPIPKLFLHQRVDARTNRAIKEIVDGQQRTRAIVDFYLGEYRLTNNVALEEARGRTYDELPGDLQNQFRDYGLNFDLFVGASDEDIREIFRRMNSFTVPLNPEEQRHAEFQGAFKWFINRFSTTYSEAFLRAGVFGQKALVRMHDQKLLTEICAAWWAGIRTTNKATLRAVYRTHDRSVDFPDDAQETLERRLRGTLDQYFAWEEVVATALARPNQAYALMLAIMHIQESVPTLEPDFASAPMADPERVIVNLTRLAQILDREVDEAGDYRPFWVASSAKTNVQSQRVTRFQWYCRALTEELPA